MSLEQAIQNQSKNELPKQQSQRSTMTVDETAGYVGVSQDMIYKLTREKKIPFIKIGGRILFKKDSIDKWLKLLEYNPK